MHFIMKALALSVITSTCMGELLDVDCVQVAAGSASVEFPIHNAASGSMQVELVVANGEFGDIDLMFVDPQGTTITTGQLQSQGGNYSEKRRLDNQRFLTATFQSAEAGLWKVVLTRSAVTQPGLVCVTVRFGAGPRPELTFDKLNRKSVGDEVVASLVVRQDNSIIKPLRPALNLQFIPRLTGQQRPSDRPIVFADDGNAATGDAAADDGIYTFKFVPTAPGIYTIVGLVAGEISGREFRRLANGTIVVGPVPAARPLAVVGDRGVDTNGDGLFEYIELDVQVDAQRAGTYRGSAFVVFEQGKLNDRGQRRTQGYGEQTLLAGRGVMRMRIAAKQIVNSAFSGKFTVDTITTSLRGFDEALGDGLLSSSYTSAQPYTWQQFDRPLVRILRYVGTRPVDTSTPKDGLFDQLDISYEIETRRAGTHSYGVNIDHACATVGIASGKITLTPGVQIVTLPVNIAADIVKHGVRGTYTIDDLAITDPAGTESGFAEDKGAFEIDPAQFVGFTGYKDCNGNQIPDRCEADLDRNGVPDDCEGPPRLDAVHSRKSHN